jgi:hypothetical protein
MVRLEPARVRVEASLPTVYTIIVVSIGSTGLFPGAWRQ